MRARRLRKVVAHVEVTAYINLIVVLVPFLLSTAVFTRLSVLDLTLPAQSSGALEQLKVDDLQLEVIIRPDALDVGDRIGGLIQRIPHVKAQADTRALNALAQQLKLKFPEKNAATVLAQPDTPYDQIVQVMDALRAGRQAPPAAAASAAAPAARGAAVELFTDISIGDAPPMAAAPAAPAVPAQKG